jgi:glutathione S-transferase
MEATKFVDLETARDAEGLRLVVVANIPSPWSEAAKGIFRIKRVPYVAVRLGPGDGEIRKWTRARNAPVAMYEKEPGRTGWADILELAERIGPERSLVPSAPADRVKMFGLSHELMGEGGLLWSSRLVSIDIGLESGGERGFPEPVAGYLGGRYGYSRLRVAQARTRIAEGFALLSDALGDRTYYFGDKVTALDVYSAAAVNLFALLPDEQCPMWAPIRAAFESTKDEVAPVPASLVAHRDRMYERHLELPMQL